MKVLALSNLYPPHYVGGYELRCEIAVKALRSRGHDVQVLTSNHNVDSVHNESSESDVSRSLRIHGFFGHPWLGIRALRELELHNNRTLRETLEKFRPDVVHVWNMGGLSKSLCLTLQSSGIPVVFDVSDHWIARSLVADVWLDWWNRTNPSIPARVLRWWWTVSGARSRWSRTAPTLPVGQIRFEHAYFCSGALRAITSSKGYDVQTSGVIHCSVDADRFREKSDAESRLRKLLYVGRLAEDKGVMTALKAMLLVKDSFKGELHIHGRGEAAYTAELHSFVRDNNLNVRFHHSASKDMPEVYMNHDALLFTSEWEEPFALTPLEAMSSGLPVIGTTTGGSVELFRHGENALTYQAGNAAELASRILDLDADPKMRQRIAKTGCDEVRARYAEPVIMDQIENYLLRAAGRGRIGSDPS